MTLFSLLISSVNHELVFAVDSIHHPWLNFQRWFLVLQWLSFRWRFLAKHWHSVFDDSMRPTWIYFCYRFYVSLVNSLTLSNPYIGCHSCLSGDFKVNGDSVFADDFWSVVTQFSLKIPCVNDDSVFSIDFIRQLWISIRCRFHPSVVTQFSKMISRSTVTHSVFDDSMRQTWIYFSYRFNASHENSLMQSTPYVSCHSYFSGDFKVNGDSVFADDFWSVVTQFSLKIPCVNDDSVFSIDFIRQPWISIRCRFHPSPLTQFSKMISRPTVTQFSLTIYGSALA